MMNASKQALAAVKQAMTATQPPSVVIGFDAFVDEVMHVVGQRQSTTSYTPMPAISDFGHWVSGSAGRSGLREVAEIERAFGGCAINQGDGLSTLGVQTHLFALLGGSTPQDVFAPMLEKCASVQRLDLTAGHSFIYEFDDGKLIFCKLAHLAEFTPSFLERELADGAYLAACQQAQAIALTSWSVLPYMTQCWAFLLEHIYSKLEHRPLFFFDLADPVSRSAEDINEMLEMLKRFEQYGQVIFSLNGNEANQIARLLGISEAEDALDPVQAQAEAIRSALGLYEVGIHLVKGAVLARAQDSAQAVGPYCAKPKKSTGAGDRFNSGYLLGHLLALEPESLLTLACECSGHYVRTAQSATLEELAHALSAS